MGYMSPAQLSQIRYQRYESLQDACVWHPASETTDGSGGYTNTWTANATTMRCSITTPSSQAAARPSMIAIVGDERGVTIALPHPDEDSRTATVKAADRLVSGDVTYEVVQVDKPGSHGVQVTAICVER